MKKLISGLVGVLLLAGGFWPSNQSAFWVSRALASPPFPIREIPMPPGLLPVIGALDSGPSVNDHGQIAFSGRASPGQPYYLSCYDSETGVVQITDGTPAFICDPAINNAGQVAFRGEIAHDPDIFLYTPGQGIVSTTLNDPPYVHAHPDINASGQVVFWGAPGASFVDDDIYVYTPGTGLTNITSDFPDGVCYGPSINDSGHVAFVWPAPGGYPRGVYQYAPGGGITKITAGGGEFLSINSWGQIAFRDAGICLYTPGNPLANITAGLFVYVNYLSLNDEGYVAFVGGHEKSDPAGVYVFDGENLISISEDLPFPAYSAPSLSDGGYLTFIGYDGFGSSTLYLVEGVPEPATLSLLAAGLVAALACRRAPRRRKA